VATVLAAEPPPSAGSFLDQAERYVDAAVLLADAARSVDPIGLLASHAVELLLKAFLLHRGLEPGELKRVGRDLMALWCLAHGAGLPIDPEQPYWIRVLDLSHDWPYR
jgi:hypothetical protein